VTDQQYIESMAKMNKISSPLLLCSALFVAGCSQEPPARTVQEFVDNPQFLEAAVVRCAQNRTETRYDAECVNARQAVSMVEAREERARRERLEAQSESKRDALRRTQQTAAAARRRAAEQEQLRKEAEYLAQFGALPPTAIESTEDELKANVPGVVIPTNDQPELKSNEPFYDDEPPVVFDELIRDYQEPSQATDGGNAPASESDEADLDAVREELRRRQEG
jgi:hypothetical protein